MLRTFGKRFLLYKGDLPPPGLKRTRPASGVVTIGGIPLRLRASLALFIASVFAGGCVAGYGLTILYERRTKLGASTTPLSHIHSPTKDYNLSGPVFYQAMEEIKLVVGADHMTNSDSELEAHADTYFNTHHPEEGQVAKYVVYPGSTDEVLKILAVCHKHKVPVVPMLGALLLEGHFVQTRQGLVIDLSRLNEVIRFSKDDLDVTVGAGLGWEDLADYLEPHGLMFGPDPGPGACIGGMAGTLCSGTNAYRYGTMRENVVNLTVVLADGTVIKTRKRPRKLSAGYNLTGLFIGLEGTLGVITEATLKLHVKPIEETVAVVPFGLVVDAMSAVRDIILRGVEVEAVELMDGNMMQCVNELGETLRKWIEQPTLFFKLGGASKAAAKEKVKRVEEVARQHQALKFEFAKLAEEQLELWLARKVALWSTINRGKQQFADAKLWTTDYAVPPSRLAHVLEETIADLEASGFANTTVAHAGDLNVHHFIVYRPSDHDKVHALVDRMVKRALDNEGTCTGEHGIGYGKRDYLMWELGEAPVDLMRKIKVAMDYYRILNPDKIFQTDPKEPGCC